MTHASTCERHLVDVRRCTCGLLRRLLTEQRRERLARMGKAVMSKANRFLAEEIRNAADLTTRNARASRKRDDALLARLKRAELRIKKLERLLRGRS
jgi:hypothetical protein